MYSILFCSVLIVFPLFLLQLTQAGNDEKWCAACRLIVEEIEYEIKKTDPHKVLEIEGFRVDPTGNQKNKKIPYARSETHLTEITESLCNQMNEFVESKSKTGRLSYVPTKSRDGQSVQLENVSISGETAEKLRYMCNSIIEEHEDSILEFFKSSVAKPKKEFCTVITNYCEGDDGIEHEEL